MWIRGCGFAVFPESCQLFRAIHDSWQLNQKINTPLFLVESTLLENNGALCYNHDSKYSCRYLH